MVMRDLMLCGLWPHSIPAGLLARRSSRALRLPGSPQWPPFTAWWTRSLLTVTESHRLCTCFPIIRSGPGGRAAPAASHDALFRYGQYSTASAGMQHHFSRPSAWRRGKRTTPRRGVPSAAHRLYSVCSLWQKTLTWPRRCRKQRSGCGHTTRPASRCGPRSSTPRPKIPRTG